MLIKALRSSFGDHGMVRRGQIIEVLDHQAQQLVKRGLYEDVKMEAGLGGDNPLSRTGGRTGAAKRSSSSLAGHQPLTPNSTEPKGAAASSPSTIRGGSPHGQTSSTPATSRGGKQQPAFLSSGD